LNLIHVKNICFALTLAYASPVVAAQFDLSTASIFEINAAIDAGALTSERLVELYLHRIEAYDQKGPSLNSILAVNPDALAIARSLDRERESTGRRSLIHGIPVIVKDVVNTKDMQTTGGFIELKGSIPESDAHLIQQLRDAGAIIFAKSNMSDWLGKSRADGGSSIAGIVVNPYDLTRRVAASSSGSGASIAAWFGTLGIGSETGTSIRNPTTDSSLFGLAPTEGLIGRSGAMANTFTHERLGPMTRNMYDLAVMLDSMVGVDVNDLVTMQSTTNIPSVSYTSFINPDGLRGARIGVLREMFRTGPEHEEGIRITENAIMELRRAGANVYDPVTLGFDLSRVRMLKVNYWEAEYILDKYLSTYGSNAPFHSIREMIEKFPETSKSSFIDYLNYKPGQDPEYLSRLKGRVAIRNAIVELMDRFELDALVFPYKTLPAEKLVRDNSDQDPVNAIVRPGDRVSQSDNYLSSMTGLPGLVVPMGYTAEGVPMGLEFLGRSFAEPVLIKLASGFEANTKLRKSPKTTPVLSGEVFSY
jgi:Asp-tRNA(Asn)/Glu-tRNA(Gln) amidotransferase A subunit family amidase